MPASTEAGFLMPKIQKGARNGIGKAVCHRRKDLRGAYRRRSASLRATAPAGLPCREDQGPPGHGEPDRHRPTLRRDRRPDVWPLEHPRPLPGVRRQGRPCPAEGPGAVRAGRLLYRITEERGCICLQDYGRIKKNCEWRVADEQQSC